MLQKHRQKLRNETQLLRGDVHAPTSDDRQGVAAIAPAGEADAGCTGRDGQDRRTDRGKRNKLGQTAVTATIRYELESSTPI